MVRNGFFLRNSACPFAWARRSLNYATSLTVKPSAHPFARLPVCPFARRFAHKSPNCTTHPILVTKKCVISYFRLFRLCMWQELSNPHKLDDVAKWIMWHASCCTDPCSYSLKSVQILPSLSCSSENILQENSIMTMNGSGDQNMHA